jgi:flavodoxin
MKVLIAYDSYFINTKMLADAIAVSLNRSGADVRQERIYQVDFSNLSDIDLLIVGAPTHNRNMPRSIKAVLKRLPKGTLAGIKTLCFDTRYKLPVKKSGSAAAQIDRLLRKIGGEPFAPPESFFVQEHRGPLFAGEIERAQQWGAALLDRG